VNSTELVSWSECLIYYEESKHLSTWAASLRTVVFNLGYAYLQDVRKDILGGLWKYFKGYVKLKEENIISW
jgi:hypothetical protein